MRPIVPRYYPTATLASFHRWPIWCQWLWAWSLGFVIGEVWWRYVFRSRIRRAAARIIEKRRRMRDLKGRRAL